jgi:hypothetical protein
VLIRQQVLLCTSQPLGLAQWLPLLAGVTVD